MLTSEAVLTEVFHLLARARVTADAAWNLLGTGGVVMASMTQDELPDVREIMRQYGDRPMDFADATLVHLARRERLDVVFTLDDDDFETYRIRGRQRFRILPGR